MKKLFLIPLMTMLCTVMAWGATVQVGDFTALKNAINNASNGDVIEFTQDITYDGAWRTVEATDLNSATTVEAALCITKSLTLDGKGYKLIGWGKHDIAIGATNGVLNCYPTSNAATLPAKKNINTIHRVTLAVHPDDPNAEIIVAIKNLSIGNTTMNKRYYGVMAFDGVKKMAWDNVKVECGQYGSQQAICTTGANSTPIELAIENSEIIVGTSGYSTYFLKPITGHFTNTSILGWSALYFKNRNIQVYGAVAGTRGSNFTCNACTFTCRNIHNGESNSFAMFPMEDDGITLNLHNCSLNAEQIGDQAQSIVSLQAATRTSGYQPVVVNISGDNTHMYNIGASAFKNNFAIGSDPYRDVITGDRGGNGEAMDVALTVNISGGTFSEHPESLSYNVYGGATTTPTIVSGYEVQEVKQGDADLYRVTKIPAEKDPGVLYDLNDAVETAAEGENPVTSFELSTGEPMQLDVDREVTTAGYVQVKDNESTSAGTVVKVGAVVAENKVDQTLVINNGLDVQGNSKVEVQAGSALIIGEGGITTEDPENIIIEADEDGAASLLLDPAITVNQTPELTVKMTVPAEHAGYEMNGCDKYRHWFRFAMPVDHMAATWVKDPDVPTYLYGWDYSNQKWAQVGVTEMVPFAGYTLSPDKEISTNTAVTYTFKGQLLGNTDCKLELNHHGYNFFGNSYTGYISILKLVDQIMGDAKIDGTVWMWDGEKYEGVPLETLRQYGDIPGMIELWKKEVAPMQTFVLRLTGSELSSTDINYADAIWGNPRYDAAKTALNAAPARRAEINDDAIIRMTIEANGQKESVVMIENSNYSDAYDRGYDAIKYMNENSFNTYVGINGENYGTVATDNLEGKMLNIKTNNELAYSISFDFVAGEVYALRDNLTGNVIAIEEGATYEFAAQPNSTVEGRFEIVGRAKMPTSIENTEVKANVKGIYTIMGQYLGEDFDILPAGVYVVNGVKIVK